MRVLVIGGTRFIGPAVVERLNAAGHLSVVLHRGQSEAELPGNVEHLHVDRQYLADFSSYFQRLRPEVVIDMSAYTERDAQTLVDVLGGIVRRFVVISSQDVYAAYGRFHGKEQDLPQPVPYDEDAPLREAFYPYRGAGRGLDDYEKILVERAARAAPVPATVLRLPMVYGERDYQRRLYLELKRMTDNRSSIFLGQTFSDWRWTRSYVENAAAAIVLAATDDRAAGRTYNVGDEPALSYYEWVRSIAVVAEWPGEVVVLPDAEVPEQLRPPPGDYTQHLIADTSRIRNELGFESPVLLRPALTATVEWERAQAGGHGRALDYAAEDELARERARAKPR